MNTLTSLQTMWSELEPERRRLLGGSIGIALFAILVVGVWSSQTQWTALQHGSSDTLGELAGVLQESGIEVVSATCKDSVLNELGSSFWTDYYPCRNGYRV